MTTETPAADIVERLGHADQHSQQRVLGSRIFKEAADEITHLRAENESLRHLCGRLGTDIFNSSGAADLIVGLQRKLDEAAVSMECALMCTPYVPFGTSVVAFDCGDPYEILTNALTSIRGEA